MTAIPLQSKRKIDEKDGPPEIAQHYLYNLGI
jgi:hypothetical protein